MLAVVSCYSNSHYSPLLSHQSVDHLFFVDEMSCPAHKAHERVEISRPAVEYSARVLLLPEANDTSWTINTSIDGLLGHKVRQEQL